MTNKQFSLKWTNYSQHIVTAIEDLRSEDDFTDVTLSCEGKRIKAHKVLLSACSKFFKETFRENPCKHPVVILKNVTFEDLESIITFMYNGQVNIVQERLASFLQTADLLQVKGLQNEHKAPQNFSTIPQHSQVESSEIPEFNSDLNGVPESEYLSKSSESIIPPVHTQMKRRRRIVPVRKRKNPMEIFESSELLTNVEQTIKQSRDDQFSWDLAPTSRTKSCPGSSSSNSYHPPNLIENCDTRDEEVHSHVKFEYEDIGFMDDSNQGLIEEAQVIEDEESSSYHEGALALLDEEDDGENQKSFYEHLEPVSIFRDISETNGIEPFATMIMTKRGYKIKFENALYTRDKVHMDKEYWRCVNTNKYKCKGRLILINQKISAAKPHNSTCVCNREEEILAIEDTNHNFAI